MVVQNANKNSNNNNITKDIFGDCSIPENSACRTSLLSYLALRSELVSALAGKASTAKDYITEGVPRKKRRRMKNSKCEHSSMKSTNEDSDYGVRGGSAAEAILVSLPSLCQEVSNLLERDIRVI